MLQGCDEDLGSGVVLLLGDIGGKRSGRIKTTMRLFLLWDDIYVESEVTSNGNQGRSQ